MFKKLVPPLLLLLLLPVVFTSCKSTSASTSKSNNRLAEQIIESASDHLGAPYRCSGTTKSGFDCSGLVYSTFSRFDIKLPRSSSEQAREGIDLGRDFSKAQKGDLIFFKTNNRNQINHVGIVIEVKDDEIQFIHSSTSKGVIISSTKEAYYKKSFVKINRILL